MPYLRFLTTACLAIVLLLPTPGVAGMRVDVTMRHAMGFAMVDDYAAAYQLADELKADYPGQVFAEVLRLNIQLTELSWDEQQSNLYEPIMATADAVLAHCRPRVKADRSDAVAHMQCGAAYFARSYVYALEGRLIKAGTNGQKTIDALEAALAENPALVDAKMYLGVAYYYADNLPPFVKAMSRLLWFIPSGNSDRSLPYIRTVTRDGTYYKEAARFIYADLLDEGDEHQVQLALAEFAALVEDYPAGFRLHLAYITSLIQNQEYEAAISARERFIGSGDWTRAQLTMIDIYYTRALLGVGDGEAAIAAFTPLDPEPGFLPFWMESWVALTRGQVQDLQGLRTAARRSYQTALKLNKRYPSRTITTMAQAGLKAPFSLPGSPTGTAPAEAHAMPRTGEAETPEVR